MCVHPGSSLKRLICRCAIALLPLAGFALAAAVVRAQEPGPTQAPAPAPSTGLSTTGGATDGEVHKLAVKAGQQRVIDAPWPVKRLSVNDPGIADVDLTSPRIVQIQGKSPGATQVTLWSDHGDVWQAQVEVEADTTRLQNDLHRMFPDASLEVVQAGQVVMLRGSLTRAEDVAQLRKYFELAKMPYVDATHIAGVQQVQLKVKVAEVSRIAIRALSSDFGFSDNTTAFAVNNAASGTFQPKNPVGTLQAIFPQDATVLGAGMAGNTQFEYFFQALADNQYLRLLAEPTLVAYSGQEATFLAGGEFPIPVAEIGGGAATTSISIEYKEFGVRLRFRPTVLGDGKINLHVNPEVSQLSDVGAIVIQGTRIPGILTRRVDTALELNSGETFAIGGLLNNQVNARNQHIPLMGDLPVIGALFRSVRYESNETELLILVTASLVQPTATDARPIMPGDTHEAPNDWELYVNGQLAGQPKPLAPAQKARLESLGLTGLRGPGGWASYDAPSNSLAGEGHKP